ncbi:hypothetical protein D9756_010556 [Leucocoprinus leucothites]|uniref:Uncharacterized protein n=1 Tax=Leucocoprinus leucothites TaxID=201217 RepID=A0A8H5FS88_9AGAR|nr:hypothetical protein D9756_010556 [Leucoagaricus leucothites]
MAYRLSTIQDAHKISFAEHGQMSKAGTHSALPFLRGDYHDYVELYTLDRTTGVRYHTSSTVYSLSSLLSLAFTS